MMTTQILLTLGAMSQRPAVGANAKAAKSTLTVTALLGRGSSSSSDFEIHHSSVLLSLICRVLGRTPLSG